MPGEPATPVISPVPTEEDVARLGHLLGLRIDPAHLAAVTAEYGRSLAAVAAVDGLTGDVPVSGPVPFDAAWPAATQVIAE